MKKRIVSLVLALCMVTALLPGTALAVGAGDYPDVSSSMWYYGDVDFVVANGYFKGGDGGLFYPDATMTRAMFVVVLARLAGVQVDNSKPTAFPDVPANLWYSGSVTWAAENGIILGGDGGLYYPEVEISREQMCVVMDRFVNYYSARTGQVHKQQGSLDEFPDAADISGYAKSAVAKCRAYGLVYGGDGGNFYPQANSTRAQVAAVIHRLAWMVKPTPGPFASSHTITYVIGENSFTKSTEATYSEPKPFTVVTNEDENVSKYLPEGFLLVSWKDADGKLYAPGGSYTTDADLVLNAQLLDEEDYIGNAVMNAMIQAQNDCQTVQTYITNVEGQLADIIGSDKVAELDAMAREAIDANPIVYNTDLDENGARPQTVSAKVSFNSDVVVYVISNAASAACELLGDELSLTEVKEIVKEIASVLKGAAGIEGSISQETVSTIADRVYNKIVAEGKSLWTNFRDENGYYFTGDVTVQVGGVSYVFTVDQENQTTSFTGGSKKEAAKAIGSALAKEMYAGLKQYTDSENPAEVVDLTGIVTFTFSRTEKYGPATDEFPYVYPVTVTLTLDGGSLVKFWFDEAENIGHVILNVTEDVQAAYAAELNNVIGAALTNGTVVDELETRAASALGENSVIASLRETVEEANIDLDVDELLAEAVQKWVAANTVQNPAPSTAAYYLPYEFFWDDEGTLAYNEADDVYSLLLRGEAARKQVLGDNTALYELIQDLSGQVAEQIVAQAKGTKLSSLTEQALPNAIKDKTLPELPAAVIDMVKTAVIIEATDTDPAVTLDGLAAHVIATAKATTINVEGEDVALENLATRIVEMAEDALKDQFGTTYWEGMTKEKQADLLITSIGGKISKLKEDESAKPENERMLTENIAYYLTDLCTKTVNEKYDQPNSDFSEFTTDGLIYLVLQEKKSTVTDIYPEAPETVVNDLISLCGIELRQIEGDVTAIKNHMVYEMIKAELDKDDYSSLPADVRSALVDLCGIVLEQVEGDFDTKLNELILSLVQEELDGEDYQSVPANVRAYLVNVCGSKLELAGYDVSEGWAEVVALIDQLVCKTFYNYNTYLEQVTDAKELKRLADVELGRLAALLNNATFQKYVAEYAGEGAGVVSNLEKLINNLPAGASLTIGDVQLSAASLDAVKDAGNLAEVCGAVADILNETGLSSLSVSDFDGIGQKVTVKYNSRTFDFYLSVVFE